MEFKKLPRSVYPEMHFVCQVEAHSEYPRIHIICQYTDDFVSIDFHMDLSRHNSIHRDPLLMRFHKTMNDYKVMYSNLIRLKRVRDEVFDVKEA